MLTQALKKLLEGQFKAAMHSLVQRAVKLLHETETTPDQQKSIFDAVHRIAQVDPSTIHALSFVALVETPEGFSIYTVGEGDMDVMKTLNKAAEGAVLHYQAQALLDTMDKTKPVDSEMEEVCQNPNCPVHGKNADGELPPELKEVIDGLKASGLDVRVIGF